MSYGAAVALQAALYQFLVADTEIMALTGGAVHDAAPPGASAGTHLVLGEEEVIDRSDISGPGAEHRFVLSVRSDAAGFAQAKAVAARLAVIVPDAALDLAAIDPAAGRLVAIWFDRAVARRAEGGAVRRVDLRFRARVQG
ncbi:MAG: DUF3168 domain-containing protein [Pararhodobacter sp.]